MKLGPGITFSWRRALGIPTVRGYLSRRTGVPLTPRGLERKIGRLVVQSLVRLATRRR